jgi:hypothetical protein
LDSPAEVLKFFGAELVYEMKRTAAFFLLATVLSSNAVNAQSDRPEQHGRTVVVVSSSADDARLKLVDEAVSFWNMTFQEIGVCYSLGPVARPAPSAVRDGRQPRLSGGHGLIGGPDRVGASGYSVAKKEFKLPELVASRPTTCGRRVWHKGQCRPRAAQAPPLRASSAVSVSVDRTTGREGSALERAQDPSLVLPFHYNQTLPCKIRNRSTLCNAQVGRGGPKEEGLDRVAIPSVLAHADSTAVHSDKGDQI